MAKKKADNDWWTLRTAALLVCPVQLLTDSAAATLLQKPVAVVASPGVTVGFDCVTDLLRPVSWSHRPVGDVVSDTLYVDSEMWTDDHRYSVTTNSSAAAATAASVLYRLIISSVRPSDAGRYVCRDNNGFAGEDFGVAELVVLRDSGMTCQENSSGAGVAVSDQEDLVTAACMFAYAGNDVLQIQWTDAEGSVIANSQSEIVDEHACDDGYRCVNSNIRVRARASTIGSLNCTVSFHQSLPGNDSETIVICTCSSRQIPVTYNTLNIHVNETADRIYAQGEVLVCSSDSDATSTVRYEWLDLDTRNKINGSRLELVSTGAHKYRCTATGTLRHMTSSLDVDVQVRVLPRGQQFELLLVCVLIFVAAVVCLSSSICVLVVRVRQKRRATVNEKRTSTVGSTDENGTRMFSEQEDVTMKSSSNSEYEPLGAREHQHYERIGVRGVGLIN